jgi:glycolate oxidase FAD binding subunit
VKLSQLEQVCGADGLQSWSEFARDRPNAAWLRADTPVASPESVEAARDVLRLAAAERLRVLPIGSGLHVVPVPGVQTDIVLSMQGIDGILEYEPDDATLVAEAGASLAAIATQAGAHAQRLGPDPWPGSGTLGGAVAANRCGLNRLRRGAWRDAVLGAQVLHADGVTTRTGGKVVKNVTGYDLAKLYVGSRGSLAILGQVNVRLLPVPELVADVRFDVPARTDPATLEKQLSALHQRADLDPVAILVVCGSVPEVPAAASGTFVLVRFEGRGSVARAQAAACANLVHGDVLSGPEGAATYDLLRRALEPTPTLGVLLRVSTLPVRVVDCARGAARSGAFAIGQFGVGTVHVRATAAQTDALAAWAREQAAQGNFLAIDGGGQDVRDGLDVTSATPATAMQRAMKRVLDPHDQLPPAPGVHA